MTRPGTRSTPGSPTHATGALTGATATPGTHAVTRWPVAVAGLLVLLVTVLPLLAGGPVPPAGGVAVAVVLAALATASTWFDEGRTLLALAVVGWVGTVLVLDDGSVAAVVIVGGLMLRVWAGLPELVRLGRAGAPDLLADLVGGGAAAGLVLLAARRTDELPPAALLLALAAALLLAVAGALRLRR